MIVQTADALAPRHNLTEFSRLPKTTVGARSAAHADARRLASRVLLELDFCGVEPTPRMFELWHAHLSLTKPDLSRQLTAALKQSSPPSPAMLDALYAEHLGREPDEHAAAETAESLRQEAQGLAEDMATNSAELRRYGHALSECSAGVAAERSVESLARALATLTVETARASERNRVLEQQLAASASRIARLRDSLNEVRRDATTDALTGLCNRKAFDSRLRRALSAAKTDGAPVSLLLLDVDHFKRVNDTHGHPVGDLVLRLIGRLLTENVKGRDTAARYGGEEFAVILAGAACQAAMVVAEQIRAALEGKTLTGKSSAQGATRVTISIGVAEYRPGETASAVISRADSALYWAKQTGRNRVCAETDDERAIRPAI